MSRVESAMLWDDITALGGYLHGIRFDRNANEGGIHPLSKKVIVATSMPGDPLHEGHIKCIQHAAKLGDLLVVIVDSDEFLLQKKGYCLLPLKHRLSVIGSLVGVNHIVPFYPIRRENGTLDFGMGTAIRTIKPNIWAKGGDRDYGNLDPEEIKVCKEINCEIITRVGHDDKSGSSSEFVKRAAEQMYHSGYFSSPEYLERYPGT